MQRRTLKNILFEALFQPLKMLSMPPHSSYARAMLLRNSDSASVRISRSDPSDFSILFIRFCLFLLTRSLSEFFCRFGIVLLDPTPKVARLIQKDHVPDMSAYQNPSRWVSFSFPQTHYIILPDKMYPIVYVFNLFLFLTQMLETKKLELRS